MSVAGLCGCGCGQRTPIAKRNRRELGHVKGQPTPFVPCHSAATSASRPLPYTVEDRGYSTSCWIFGQHIAATGYGQVSIGGQLRLAHRVFYERAHGPIPDGLTVDHLCRVRACVNPDHMEIVTRAENLRRGQIGRSYTR